MKIESPKNHPRPFVSVKEAADYLEVSESTFRTLSRRALYQREDMGEFYGF